MGVLNENIRLFRINLISILSGTVSHSQLKEVISLSHALAIILLKKKLSSGKLNLSLVSLDLHDLAYDCIAELFRTDEKHSLVQLKSYFGGLNIDQVSDVQLLDHLRRLVFSKVNQGIFRIYFEYDSSLGKIIRNTKLAVQSLNNFSEIDRFGDTFLVPSLVDPQFHLPIVSQETLSELLHENLTGNERIPEVLAYLSKGLQEQNVYAKAVSLIGFAITLRKIFSQDVSEQDNISFQPTNKTDALELIKQSSKRIQQGMIDKYVAKNKLTFVEYEKMFIVVQKNLAAIAIDNDGRDFSLYDQYKKELPELTKDQYSERYKAILEYLLTLTKKELGKELRRQL